ncbi:probable C6 transcription factor [Rhynchosporium agropyri]|uniref:Probable C6 transcription factor n=1 Tax=Rhynchosporium agropyri TaxID=914238 RepID=A0A1E1JYA4_9HELO|nr:probable C6 transcription factor [Rhynchosporium agropyri]
MYDSIASVNTIASVNFHVSPFCETGETYPADDAATMSSFDEYAANPRFLELQEELRAVLFTGVASHTPSRSNSPTQSDRADEPDVPASSTRTFNIDFTNLSIPKVRLIKYLKNWIDVCAPHLDKFDEERHFGIHAPIIARSSPALLYAILAFSARQTERRNRHEEYTDSLELYQESIRRLAPCLQAKEPNVLVTVCILACLELMSVSPRDWRRHVEGCAALMGSLNVNGMSGGLLQAVFWCYARMDLCGALTSNDAESMVLHINKWVPTVSGFCSSLEEEEDMVKDMFFQKSRLVPDMHANWAVYLCAKTCYLVSRRTRYLEFGEVDTFDRRPFQSQWTRLWEELCFWTEHRPPAMLPIKTTSASGSQIFPEVLFTHWAAISGNQLYHTACILMLEVAPQSQLLQPLMPHYSAIWHARRVCGISLTNPHSGNLINAIQPLYIAGKLFSHRSEHLAVAKLFKICESTTGWGALWRLKDLERVWGYNAGEILAMI